METKQEINKVELIQINVLRVDGGTQSRAALDQTTVNEYAQAMLDGAQFPVLFAYWDGETFWLAEGFHRVAAAKQAGIEALHVKVYPGGRREALSHSLTANVKHGLRRTNADKRHCVTLMLLDEEWVKWSDGQIAQHCSVDPKTVSNIRKELILTMEIPESDVRKGADGRTYDTSAIGKKKPGIQPKKPDEHGCLACGEIFDKEVWHCPTCNTHWPPSKDTCPNCYKAPTVTTTKLTAAAVADQVFGEGDEPSAEDETIQKPAHIAPQGDLLEAVNWQAVADSLLAENLALKKDLEEARKLIRQFEEEKADLQETLVSVRSTNKDLNRDRQKFFSQTVTLNTKNTELEGELTLLAADKAHWFGVAEQLREELDEAKATITKLEEEEIGSLLVTKANLNAKVEMLQEDLRAATARVETLGTLADGYCAQAKTEMDEKFRFQMMIVSALAGAPKLVTEDVLKGTTPLRDAMFKLQEMLGLASDSNGNAEQLREELDTVTAQRNKLSKEFNDLLMERAGLQGDLLHAQSELKAQIAIHKHSETQLQDEKKQLIGKIRELEAQITSFTSGTADATHAGAHAPARALSLVPTTNIHGEEREKEGSAEGNQTAVPATPKAKRQAKNVKRQLPEDFPVQELQEWAAENHPSVNFEVEFEKFKDHHQAKGNTFADWLSAGRNWIRRAEEYKQSTPGFPRSKNNGTATPRPRTSQDSYVFTPKEII